MLEFCAPSGRLISPEYQLGGLSISGGSIGLPAHAAAAPAAGAVNSLVEEMQIVAGWSARSTS
jgi:hypothetical protein